ncbi:KdsC family phosphatase [Planctomycetota bacterium]
MSLKRIKMLILDVDGVLTDGRITMDERGRELVSFDVQDGSGLKYLARSAIRIVFLSGRVSSAVKLRARNLEIKEVYLGIKKKLPVLKKLIRKYKLKVSEICYIGDDLLDLSLMRRVGYPVAVRNARPEVKKHSRYITRALGGHGAVREVVEKILKAQNKWNTILKKYL